MSMSRLKKQAAATAALLETLMERDHFVAKGNQAHETGFNSGRFYYPLATGRRRYVPHDPIAVAMQAGLLWSAPEPLGDAQIFVTEYGKAWLKTI